jgi:hypothetical protein
MENQTIEIQLVLWFHDTVLGAISNTSVLSVLFISAAGSVVSPLFLDEK